MITKFIEATNGPQNWGKFAVSRFSAEEWAQRSEIDPPRSLIGGRGWTREHIHVLDLQTGEGAIFRPGGHAPYDLGKHRIWVCPLFEPFLTWLYQQDLTDLDALPGHIDLPEAEFSFTGYRRPGFLNALLQVLSLAENHQMWRDPMASSERFKDFVDEQYDAIQQVRAFLKENGVTTIHELTAAMAERQEQVD